MTDLRVAHSELILGGERSGKTARAEALAAAWLAQSPRHRAVYIATAQAWDEEMRERISRHQRQHSELGPRMATVEAPVELAHAIGRYSRDDTLIVVDCPGAHPGADAGLRAASHSGPHPNPPPEGEGTGSEGERTETEAERTGSEAEGTGSEAEGTGSEGERIETERPGTGSKDDGMGTEGVKTGNGGEGLQNSLSPWERAGVRAPEGIIAGALRASAGPIVLISNEIGLGPIAPGQDVRTFLEALGGLNQEAAAACERVTLMSAGMPLTLKGSS